MVEMSMTSGGRRHHEEMDIGWRWTYGRDGRRVEVDIGWRWS